MREETDGRRFQLGEGGREVLGVDGASIVEGDAKRRPVGGGHLQLGSFVDSLAGQLDGF